MQSPAKQQHSTQDSASTKPGKMFKYRRWLGYWNPGLDSIRTETELALHVSYCWFNIAITLRLGVSGQEPNWLCMYAIVGSSLQSL